MDELRPGDRVGRFTVDRPVAYQGREGCTSSQCTRLGFRYDPERREVTDWGDCAGWHCAVCHEPCSMMGHDCPEDPDRLAGEAA